MKLIIVLMAVFMMWSANAFTGETHILLGVDGVACPFCVYGIEKQLKKADGVEDVNTDLALGKIWVKATGTDLLSEGDARSLLEQAGFTLRSFEVHQGATGEHGKNESGQHE